MKTLRRGLALLAMCAAWLVPPSSKAQIDVAASARDLIVRMDLEAARRLLLVADPDEVHVALERARLAVYEMDCDAASVILARPDVQKMDDGATLAEIAHGCSRATAAVIVTHDGENGIDVEWQDERDAPLGPLLTATVVQARDMLSRDLGVDWPRPTRVVVVRDALSLSAMTGLPYASAQTTGTVAVAKWGRVTLLSPRATPHGYVWRDTIAHELTHLAVTRASGDRAPLWLQEGVAKFEETRWRPAQPFDDWPPADALAKRAVESGQAFTLDKLGPSIAMLPSADAAAAAFAQVTSFVRFYLTREGEGALPKLLRAIRDAPNVELALRAASGSDIKAWDARWRAYIATRPRDPRLLSMGLGGPAKNDKKTLVAYRDQRDRTRLAELLVSRGHAAAAVKELDQLGLSAESGRGGSAESGRGGLAAAAAVSPELRERRLGDPTLRWLRGVALEQSKASSDAEEKELFDDPGQVISPYGPWWASRGRWQRGRGDEAGAGSSFSEAVANDPLDPECACEALPASISPRSSDPLCIAAEGWAVSPFDD
jgi:hypothetical protein